MMSQRMDGLSRCQCYRFSKLDRTGGISPLPPPKENPRVPTTTKEERILIPMTLHDNHDWVIFMYVMHYVPKKGGILNMYLTHHLAFLTHLADATAFL